MKRSTTLQLRSVFPMEIFGIVNPAVSKRKQEEEEENLTLESFWGVGWGLVLE